MVRGEIFLGPALKLGSTATVGTTSGGKGSFRVKRKPPVSLRTTSRQKTQGLKPPSEPCPKGTAHWSQPSLLPISHPRYQNCSHWQPCPQYTYTQLHESIQPSLTHSRPPVYLVSMGEEPTTSQHYAKDGEAAVERPPPPSGHNNMHLGGVFKAGLSHLAKSS